MAKLGSARLIERRPEKIHGRIQRTKLTAAGRRVLIQAQAVAERCEALGWRPSRVAVLRGGCVGHGRLHGPDGIGEARPRGDAGDMRMRVGFVGLGALGAKLAGSLLRHGVDLAVHDLDPVRVEALVARGARAGGSPAALMRGCDVVITCLPSPAASDAVLREMLPEIREGRVWVEMSTTDGAEVRRLAAAVEARGGAALECPVSGGCHRAATGNISIFAGGERAAFERVLPLLRIMGRRILHTGPLGSASTLKVMTNYLATTHLVALGEALATMRAAGLDMATTFEAIRISSGNSFVHETEGQLILSGSRDVDFTLDLVAKDLGLFQGIAEAHGAGLDLSPLVVEIVADARRRLGGGAQSDRIVELLEARAGVEVLAPGFPRALVDDEPEGLGQEVTPPGHGSGPDEADTPR